MKCDQAWPYRGCHTDTSYAWVVMTGGGAGGGRGDTETLVSLPQPLLSALVSPAQLEAT